MAKTTIDKLDSAVQKILDDYAKGILTSMDEVATKIGTKAAAAVKANARASFGGSGKYAGGWTKQVEKTRLGITVTVYNKAAPGLAHLLENGHAKTGGGRVAGKAHIAPVETEVVKEYQEKIENVVSGY